MTNKRLTESDPISSSMSTKSDAEMSLPMFEAVDFCRSSFGFGAGAGAGVGTILAGGVTFVLDPDPPIVNNSN